MIGVGHRIVQPEDPNLVEAAVFQLQGGHLQPGAQDAWWREARRHDSNPPSDDTGLGHGRGEGLIRSDSGGWHLEIHSSTDLHEVYCPPPN